MNNVQFLILIAITVISAFWGGFVGNAWFLRRRASLQPATADENRVVAAREFKIIGKDGRAFARLYLAENGKQPLLTFSDEYGQTKITLGLWLSGSPILGFNGTNGKVRASLSLSPSGEPYLAFLNENKEVKAQFALLPDLPNIIIRDDNGYEIWHAP